VFFIDIFFYEETMHTLPYLKCIRLVSVRPIVSCVSTNLDVRVELTFLSELLFFNTLFCYWCYFGTNIALKYLYMWFSYLLRIITCGVEVFSPLFKAIQRRLNRKELPRAAVSGSARKMTEISECDLVAYDARPAQNLKLLTKNY